ncbi:nucleotidyltransferase domain-containing protein [Rhizorhapis sp. SPR117]|uniref:nucleotidyltransferase domain-containing protein n=1 Tax=Rhizorhapis sp. SPR117 TaxID=2912611 RepID=UPI001F1AD83C|nr:nucleotidyltransferase family protein [Rhizorhapis sp. SPR117]
MSALVLVQALRDPASVTDLDMAGWNGLIAMARAEQLIGSLAYRFGGLALPAAVERMMLDARRHATFVRRQALWEADRARVALAGVDAPVILLKGTAYVAAGLRAGVGRHIGDLDIMVPRPALTRVEKALISAGWEWVKPDPYDDQYYRRWMHELPPLIHKERDRMIDVHHTILPLTARQRPDADAMIADRLKLDNGLSVLAPEDMVLHCIAHLFADGDLAGGLRNLWDLHCLLDDFGTNPAFAERLEQRAARHQLAAHLKRAVRLSSYLYGAGADLTLSDRFYIRRLLARDEWGRETQKLARLAFYVRSHWLRMPPLMLARHLWTKWRKGR